MSDHEDPGFAIAPSRYNQGETEVIDVIRAQLGDVGFVAFCRGMVIKYDLRSKDADVLDVDKALWYDMMADHVEHGGDEHPDPRQYRK